MSLIFTKAILPSFSLIAFCVALSLTVGLAHAQDGNSCFPPTRQSLDDAWWTGPILANSAGTLTRGHVLIEPYFYDVHAAHSDSYGSRAYVLYGLLDRLTVGFIPIVGFNTSSGLGNQFRALKWRN